jgi:hypothetical protein
MLARKLLPKSYIFRCIKRHTKRSSDIWFFILINNICSESLFISTFESGKDEVILWGQLENLFLFFHVSHNDVRQTTDFIAFDWTLEECPGCVERVYKLVQTSLLQEVSKHVFSKWLSKLSGRSVKAQICFITSRFVVWDFIIKCERILELYFTDNLTKRNIELW